MNVKVLTGPSRLTRLRWAGLLLIALLLAACSSGLQRELPELETTATSSLKVRVASGNDDVGEAAGGGMRLGGTLLDFSVKNGVAQTVGLRFSDVGIPPGAKVTKAYIEFRSGAADSGAVSLQIRGEAADDAQAFTTAQKSVSSRPKTAASSTWKPLAWSAGKTTRTSELAGIVQEIVNRGGWEGGNAVAFIVTGNGKVKRSAVSFDGGAAPSLVVTFEAPPTAEDPAPEPPPSELEPVGGRSGYSLKADPSFDRGQLPAEMRVWYDRLMSTIENPKYSQYPQLQRQSPDARAGSGDLYQLGRGLSEHVTSLMTTLRVTGDPALVAEVDRLMEIARGTLRDTNGDGYLNWLYLRDSPDASDRPFIGTDEHVMDEILAHSMVAAAAYTLKQNAHLNPSYGEHAAFWTDYLTKHWEAKWRARKGIPTGFPFVSKYLLHPYSQSVRLYYYLAKLTGDSSYHAEAQRIANRIAGHVKEVSSPVGPALVWSHQYNANQWNPPLGCQPSIYVTLTMQAWQDLALENFSVFSDGFMQKVANAFSQFVMDDGITSLAPNICGGVSRGGVTSTTTTRMTFSIFVGFNYQSVGKWDETGKIERLTRQLYDASERSHVNAPRRPNLPAQMVFLLSDN